MTDLAVRFWLLCNAAVLGALTALLFCFDDHHIISGFHQLMKENYCNFYFSAR